MTEKITFPQRWWAVKILGSAFTTLIYRKKNVGCKGVYVVSELYNTGVNAFGPGKSVRCKVVLVLTELVVSEFSL